MGKIVATEFISLDGVMEDPGGAVVRRATVSSSANSKRPTSC